MDLEDELDKLIDLKSTRVSMWVFMAGILVGLAGLACGLQAKDFVIAVGASMLLSGMVGDLASLVMYRRGV